MKSSLWPKHSRGDVAIGADIGDISTKNSITAPQGLTATTRKYIVMRRSISKKKKESENFITETDDFFLHRGIT